MGNNEKVIALRDQNNWDNKTWSQLTGISQRVLEGIESKMIEINEEQYNMLVELTEKEKGKESKLFRFDEPKVIAFGNHKGGPGKTTMCTNIAYELSEMGYNVLIIDTDSQMDATKTFFDEEYADFIQSKNFYECLTARSNLQEAIISTQYERIDLIAANVKLSNIELFLSTMSFKEKAVIDCLAEIKKENYYDFILFDMDKNIGQLNTAVLMASDYLMIVSECATYHLDGIGTMKQQYELVHGFNDKLSILGIILNKVNARKEVAKEAMEIIEEIFPGKMFQSFVRNDAVVEKAQWNQMAIADFAKNSDAARQIRNITAELLDRIG